MLKLTLQRLAAVVPLVFLVSLLTFAITDLLPGDPAEIIVGDSASQEQVDEVTERLGLDQPLYERYVDWVGGVVRGDFGTSYYNSVEVVDAVRDRAPVTLSLTFGAVVVGCAIGISSGIVSALRPRGLLDRSVTAVSAIGQALPNFWFAMLLVTFLAVNRGWFPAIGYTPFTESPVEWLRSIALPSIALGTSAAAVIARQTRGSLIDVLRRDYVRAARSQGLSEWRVVLRHALPNALVPVVTVLGFQVTALLGGSLIVEQVFAMNGLGSLAVSSVRTTDVPMVQGVVIVSVVVVVVVQLATDLAYALLNPKARPS